MKICIRTKLIIIAVLLAFFTSACVCGPQEQNAVKKTGLIRIGLSLDTLKEERWQYDRDLFVARAKELNVLVRDAWKDGEEREVTFIYSACGCPVKAMVKRVGDRTARTKDLPVMFPDDPAAVATIGRLMRW